MKRQIYVNGDYVAEDEAKVSVLDRGFLFGDAIYEVTAMIDGHLVDNGLHLARFERSLGELDISLPLPLAGVQEMQRELVRRNGMTDGVIYLQVSRGVADRDFHPMPEMTPTFIAFTQSKKLYGTKSQEQGIAVALVPDPRWNRRDIKTVMLLGQVLAKREARARGFDDVWLVEDGCITEGASSTAFIVTHSGTIVTRPNSRAILPGCTRRAVMSLAQLHGLALEERPFTLEEAQGAAEAFLTSASNLVTPVVRIADSVIGDGKPGPATQRLQSLYLDAARSCEKIA